MIGKRDNDEEEGREGGGEGISIESRSSWRGRGGLEVLKLGAQVGVITFGGVSSELAAPAV